MIRYQVGTKQKKRVDYEFWLFIIIIFLTNAVFRHRDYDDKSLDFQIVLRLGSWAFAALMLFARPALITHVLFVPRNLGWILFFVYNFANSFHSPTGTFAIIAAGSLLFFYIYVSSYVGSHGQVNAIEAYIWAAFLICAISLIVYFAFPSFGRLREWVGTEQISSGRISGIAGSANAVGAISGSGILCLFIYWNKIKTINVTLRSVFMVILLICLAMSLNRMAIASTLITTSIYLLFYRLPFFSLLLMAGTAIVLIVLFVAPNDPLLLLSRSGSETEITSLTGRAQIWSVVFDLWKQKPIFGWGYNAGITVLPTTPGLFATAANVHNLYLEILFTQGLLGLALFIVALISFLLASLSHRDLRAALLVGFNLISGFTELGPISGIVQMTFVLFAIGISSVTIIPRSGRSFHKSQQKADEPTLSSRRPSRQHGV